MYHTVVEKEIFPSRFDATTVATPCILVRTAVHSFVAAVL